MVTTLAGLRPPRREVYTTLGAQNDGGRGKGRATPACGRTCLQVTRKPFDGAGMAPVSRFTLVRSRRDANVTWGRTK